MAKATPQNFDSINFIGPLMLILYLCIGFIPNLEAVDKIAPQWDGKSQMVRLTQDFLQNMAMHIG